MIAFGGGWLWKLCDETGKWPEGDRKCLNLAHAQSFDRCEDTLLYSYHVTWNKVAHANFLSVLEFHSAYHWTKLIPNFRLKIMD